jgi:starch synthase
MHIVHFTSELAPIAKVGGLGDVVYGLCKELIRLGHTVEIILPKYDTLRYDLLKNLKVCYRELWSYEGPYRYNNTIWSCEIDSLTVYLIEPHHPRYFFHRGMIYGCHDDIDRFLYFSRAAMEFLYKSGKNPDALHLHDWPTATIPLLLKEMYQDLGMKPTRTLLTLHNLEHQGRCSPKCLSQIGLRGEEYLTPDLLQDSEDASALNLLKGGIAYADHLTTVSPSYEQEIQTPDGGHGLSSFLQKHKKKLKGILNGIDEDFWNPEKDPYLPENFPAHPPFSPKQVEQIEISKSYNKRILQQKLSLPETAAPLAACISRLVPQKAPKLIASAFQHVLEQGGQCVILGSIHDPEMFELFSSLKQTSTAQGIIILEYDEALSHLIYGASDFFIVPSIFEPCGLTQMIALRYGSIPLVRNTGGLKDTVFDVDTSPLPSTERNGFVFEHPTEIDLRKAISRALNLWKTNRKEWIKLRMQGMARDHSWKRAALEYLKLYI